MLRSIAKPTLEPVQQGLVSRPREPRASDLVQPRLVGSAPRAVALVGSAVEFDPIPARPAEDERQRESLPDEGDEDDAKREQQDEVPFGERRGQGEGGGE